MNDPFKATVATCVHRDVKIRMWNSLWGLRDCPNPKINIMIQEGDALISRSRNKVATHFLKNLDDELLCFIDDDIEINSLDFTRMMWEVHVNKYPILGAAYALKNHEKSGFALYPTNEAGSLEMGKSGKIIPVTRVSTGCMIIRREVLDKMVKKGIPFCEDSGNYAFFQHVPGKVKGKWKELSEDWFFCQTAMDMGFQPFLDCRPKLNHVGPFPYNWDFVMLNGQYKKYDDVNLKYDLSK